MSSGVIQEIDTLDIVKSIGRESKRFQAIFLQKLEEVIPKSSQEYQTIRKFFLDESSNNTRAVVREIFGDIDYLIM
jgi:hypothetical protein